MMIKKEAPDRVIIAGDWHCNLRWAEHVVERAAKLLADEEDKIILQAGDFGVWRDLVGQDYLKHLNKAAIDNDVEIWFIDGNHEDFPYLRNNFRGQTAEYLRLIWLERGSSWTWHGKRWLALGGATSLDRPGRTEGTDWFPEEEITDEDAHFAVRRRADVMLTHDCPSAVVHYFPDFGWSVPEVARAERHSQKLQYVVNLVQPAHLIHGHLHICYQRPVQMPYGACTVTGLAKDGNEDNWFVLDTRTMEFLPHDPADGE